MIEAGPEFKVLAKNPLGEKVQASVAISQESSLRPHGRQSLLHWPELSWVRTITVSPGLSPNCAAAEPPWTAISRRPLEPITATGRPAGTAP